MHAYTYLLIGHSNKVVECGSVSAASSAEAGAEMEHLLHHRASLTAIEVWDGGSLATRLTQTDLPTPSAQAASGSTLE
jgi:hypothetical protein